MIRSEDASDTSNSSVSMGESASQVSLNVHLVKHLTIILVLHCGFKQKKINSILVDRETRHSFELKLTSNTLHRLMHVPGSNNIMASNNKMKLSECKIAADFI